MSRSGIGQSYTKWLKRAGQECRISVGPPPALGGKAWCCWYRHDASLPQRYTISILTRLWQSVEGYGVERLRDVHCDGYGFARGLVLIEASRAEAVECLGLKPFWEGRVASSSTMAGRMSRSRIFTAGRSSEMGQ